MLTPNIFVIFFGKKMDRYIVGFFFWHKKEEEAFCHVADATS
jgi:hypothetical protein